VTGTRLNTTLLDLLKWYSVPKAVRSVIYALVILTGSWIIGRVIWKSKSLLEVTIAALLVSFAITPYALQYDFPPLAIVLFWALAISGQQKAGWIPAIMIAFITSVLIWERPISDGYWIVIGLSVLTVWLFMRSKGQAAAQAAEVPS
jgi:hypothetical protein